MRPRSGQRKSTSYGPTRAFTSGWGRRWRRQRLRKMRSSSLRVRWASRLTSAELTSRRSSARLSARRKTGWGEVRWRSRRVRLRLRHRDAVAAGRNTGNEGVGSVDPDALPLLPAAVPRDCDVDRPRVRVEHSPHGSSALVADHSPGTEGKDGRHTAAFEAESGMPHRVHPAMNAVQPPGLATPGSRDLRDAAAWSWARADDAMLPGGDLARSVARYWRVGRPPGD